MTTEMWATRTLRARSSAMLDRFSPAQPNHAEQNAHHLTREVPELASALTARRSLSIGAAQRRLQGICETHCYTRLRTLRIFGTGPIEHPESV